ncbi:MaoC family dehydratase [Sphingomonas paeninsulae]|jgi:acyl dehydratase|uniref:MaoC family dehydratase n=1 Tax=Sphingomonas paeninsulae TaxID=2319844 RepID=A0A494TCY5_SPHPE|nr:MaoC family dehydratase [Sphingomonas paeninsulae]AYJ87070.1 MaoC family dehydratase [Sphingomonas paeninsulae]
MKEPTVFFSPRALVGREGMEFGPTDWLEIDQQRIDKFADATNDHQWIHVDPERAAAGPFGKTIAHGYLTLSLANDFLPKLIDVRGFSHGVNVGSDRTRFLSPVPVGSRIRARGEVVSVEEIKGAIQSIVRITIEIDGETKPACIVETISRYYPED